MTDFTYEKGYWGTCQNTFEEERKQLVYAKYMGLQFSDYNSWIVGLEGKKILDIGGGPSSLLLKTNGLARAKVIDPLQYPTWVYHRYDAAKVEWEIQYGEQILEDDDSFDEVWIYNVLQHTQNPEEIIRLAGKVAPIIRMFEWINIPPYAGHPQHLTEERLNKALNATGTTGRLEDTDCYHIWVKLR